MSEHYITTATLKVTFPGDDEPRKFSRAFPQLSRDEAREKTIEIAEKHDFTIHEVVDVDQREVSNE